MNAESLLAKLPPGRWVVGVSGHADSVALLVLLHQHRPDITPIVCHVNHKLRGSSSEVDQAFVLSLAEKFSMHTVCLSLATLISPHFPSPTEAVLRRKRYELLGLTCRTHKASGILTAHHADDRAETALLRLARHSAPWTIDGLHARTVMRKTPVLRPLLDTRKSELLDLLRRHGIEPRLDATNDLLASRRNVVRKLLTQQPALFEQAIELADISRHLREQLNLLPRLTPRPDSDLIADMPDVQAHFLIRRWVRESQRLRISTHAAVAILDICRDGSLSRFVTLGRIRGRVYKVWRHRSVLSIEG